jgi:uncharacterized protein (DUF983 family)
MTVEITIPTSERRELMPAILKGLRCRCPKCGEGKLFRAYLKVADRCSNCGEEFFHHKADDLPPYLAIIIVGHIIIGLMMELSATTTLEPFWYLVTMVPLALFLPLAMLPSIKGAVVALQWANRMHGFDPRHRDPALPDEA